VDGDDPVIPSDQHDTEISNAQLDEWLATAAGVARDAGSLVAERYTLAHHEDQKGHAHNLVTETDHASEELIVAALTKAFPNHGITAEEGRGRGERHITWVVDPLDGTNNFAHGFPMFCISMAAMRGNEVLVGVTYDPLRDELFTARRDGGATMNGRTIHVSSRRTLAESLVATGFPYDKSTNQDNNLAQFVAVAPRVRGIRRAGSAALDLAYVAIGRLDAYWEHGTKAWDVATGVLLVMEAGGRVTDYENRPPRIDGGRFVASNGLIHEELLSRLADASQL
jgi:myo-inositol-1(or 4)-monophosphatase